MVSLKRATTSRLSECWPAIVHGVQHDDPEAASELYRGFAGHRNFFAAKFSPEEAEDLYHDLIVALIASIRSGSVRKPERLAGYVMTIARRLAVGHMRTLTRRRQYCSLDVTNDETVVAPSADETAIQREIISVARRVLNAMSARDRAVIVRFYLEEQSASRICEELNLSESQFRNIKHRAKARLASLMERHIGREQAPDLYAQLR